MTTIDELQTQLLEKDEFINSLKERTKVFVSKLKDDNLKEQAALKQQHESELEALKQQHFEKIEQAKNFILKQKEDMETMKSKGSEDQTTIKNLEIQVQLHKNDITRFKEIVEKNQILINNLNDEIECNKVIVSNFTDQLEESKGALSKLVNLEQTIEALQKQLDIANAENEREFKIDKSLTELGCLRGGSVHDDNESVTNETITVSNFSLSELKPNQLLAFSSDSLRKTEEELISLTYELEASIDKNKSLEGSIQLKDIEHLQLQQQTLLLQNQLNEKESEVKALNETLSKLESLESDYNILLSSKQQLDTEILTLHIENTKLKQIIDEYEKEDSRLVEDLDVEKFRLENVVSSKNMISPEKIATVSLHDSNQLKETFGRSLDGKPLSKLDLLEAEELNNTKLLLGEDTMLALQAALQENSQLKSELESKTQELLRSEEQNTKNHLSREDAILALQTALQENSQLKSELESKTQELLRSEEQNTKNHLSGEDTILALQTALQENSQLKSELESKTQELLRSEEQNTKNHLSGEDTILALQTALQENSQLKSELESKTQELLRSEEQNTKNHLSGEDTILALQTALQENSQLKSELESKTQELLRSEEQNTKNHLSGEDTILALQTALQENSQLKSELESKTQELFCIQEAAHLSQIAFSSLLNTKSTVDEEYSVLVKEKVALLHDMSEKDVIIKQLEDKQSENSNTSLQLTKMQSRVKDLLQEIDALQGSLAAKTSDIEFLRSSLQASSELCSSLQNQNQSLKSELEQVSSQLQNEIDQNNERKKKLKDYLTNLNNEKNMLEANLASCQNEISNLSTENNSLKVKLVHIDQEKELSEMKHAKAYEQALLEKDLIEREAEKTKYQLNFEINSLQAIVDSHSKGTSDQLKDAYTKVEEANKELEGHKSKRLQARNEMIGMAQVLENVQKESEMLKSELGTIIPMVYDQVSNLENLLMNIERASNQLSNKRMVKLQTKANDFVIKRFRKSTRNSSARKIPTVGTNNCNDNFNGISAISPMKASMAFKKNYGMNSNHSVSALTDALEQAESLRYEIDRVKAGIVLVNQSMDKLSDVVAVDTRCCGGLCDALSNLPFLSPFFTQAAVSKGYGQLGHDEQINPSVLNEDEYSASLLENKAGISSSTSSSLKPNSQIQSINISSVTS